jgi:Amt family ammonium transporter
MSPLYGLSRHNPGTGLAFAVVDPRPGAWQFIRSIATEAHRVSRFLSPLMLLAGLWLGVGITPLAAQDDPIPSKDKTADVGPKPRVVGEEKKQPPKAEAPKPEEPKKLTFEPVIPVKAEQKEEEKKDEPKKDEPKKEEPKAEEKKEDPKKEDPLAAVDKKASDAATAATVATQRGDNAWILVSSALVLLMTPGLALFYGGMVRRKNVLATMMQSYAAMAVVGLYWVAVGYGLAFGESQIIMPDGIATIFGDDAKGGGIIGWSNKLFFLKGVEPTEILPGYNIPVLTHVMFQGMFAIITPALISGAVAERIRFWPWVIFMILWITFVYCPLAHMVWAFDWFYADPATPGAAIGATATGLLGKAGALDFAGGTVVHIAAGFGGLACMLVLKKRTGYPEHAMHPNSMVLTLIGAGLLWVGWFGFNGGSALGSGDLGSTGFATTQAAAAAAGLSWMIVEWIFKGKPTALGLASGIVAGLVAVTPASGFVYAWGGALIGIAAGVVCYFAVQIKAMLGYDDSLDAFGVHGVGGFLGAVLTGVFCYASIQAASKDGFFAHRGLPGQITALKEEKTKLSKEIEEIKKDEPKLKKEMDDAAAKADAEKDEKKKKKSLQKEADAAKAAYEEIAKKVERREARIKAIGAESEDGSDLKKLQDKIDGYKEAEKGPMSQVGTQLLASAFSAVFAFVISLVLAIAVQAMTLGNFRTSVPDENEGLDQTEHGETGFDYGGIDTFPATTASEPKAAKVPPGGKRFQVVVEGVENGELMKAWSQLCQPSDVAPDPDFTAVYRYVTTVQGNRFRLRGGDPKTVAAQIQKLFQKKLGKPLKVRVED